MNDSIPIADTNYLLDYTGRLIHGIEEVFVSGSDWHSGDFHLQALDSGESWRKFSVMTMIFILFAVIRLLYYNKFRTLMESFVNPRYMRQMIREELVLFHPFSLIMTILFCLSGGALLQLSHGFFSLPDYNYPDWQLFLLFSGAVLLFLLVKTLLGALLISLTGSDGGQLENLFNTLFFNQVSVIVLLPVLTLCYFGPQEYLLHFLITAGLVLALFYLFRLFRGVLAGIASGTSGFYIFLYLCSLEIIPFIVLMRLLMREIG